MWECVGTRCLHWMSTLYMSNAEIPPSRYTETAWIVSASTKTFFMNQEIIRPTVNQTVVNISHGSGRKKRYWSYYPDISLIELRNQIRGACCGFNLDTNGKLFGKQLPMKHTSENCFSDGLNMIHPVWWSLWNVYLNFMMMLWFPVKSPTV